MNVVRQRITPGATRRYRVTKWYEEHGRHEIFAGGHSVPLDSTEHTLTINPEAVLVSAQTDLDELCIPKTPREESCVPGPNVFVKLELMLTWKVCIGSTCSSNLRWYRSRARADRSSKMVFGLAASLQSVRKASGLPLSLPN
jgi:hypothetical protein